MAESFSPEQFPVDIPLSEDVNEISRYMSGGCHYLAWALAEKTGLKLAAVIDPSLNDLSNDRYGRFRHACVVWDDPADGIRYAVDIMGRRRLEDFIIDQLRFLRWEWEDNGVGDEWDPAERGYLDLIVDGEDAPVREWICELSLYGDPLYSFDPTDPNEPNLKLSRELLDRYLEQALEAGSPALQPLEVAPPAAESERAEIEGLEFE